jgi:short-subunit dehydrogenase
MNVIREILKHFRKQKHGVIINITSMGGILTFPIYSVYHASKWAMEGFSEALQYEVRPFNVKIKVIEPGAIKTDFYSRSMDLFKGKNITDYDNYFKVTYSNTQKAGDTGTDPEVVAKKIFKAATDKSWKLRYPVGSKAPLFIFLKRILPLSWFYALVRANVEKGFKGN